MINHTFRKYKYDPNYSAPKSCGSLRLSSQAMIDNT